MYIYKNNLSPARFLQSTQNSLAKLYLDDLETKYQSFKDMPIPELEFSKFRMFDETGDRAVYEKEYFARRRRLAILELRVWMYQEKDDIKALEDLLWAVCNEFTWALPAHVGGIMSDNNIPYNTIDLFAAETGHTISETLSMCGELLHPVVVRRCISEVFKRIIEPFESKESEKYHLWWEYGTNNWAAVCGGAVGMTAIYLIEDENRLKAITDRTKAACNRFIDSCTDDGVCLEGSTYWNYAMQYYWGFADLLAQKTGENIITHEEKMKNLALFPSAVCLGNNHAIAFADASGIGAFEFGIICKIHERYNTPVPEQSYYPHFIDNCARSCSAVRNIAWFNPDLSHDNSSDNDDIFFPHGQWAVIRSVGSVLAIKGGHNDEPHNHNDIGSFMYINNGTVLTSDLGCPQYTKAYFDEHRYEHINANSFGHSVPIINSCGQHEGGSFRADSFAKTENGVEISFAGAYDKSAGINKLIRNASLNKQNGSILISDKFEFIEADNDVTERIITRLDAEIVNNTVVLSENGKTKGKIEFLTKGNISVSEDSYIKHNAKDNTIKFRIIDLTVETKNTECEITYKISN